MAAALLLLLLVAPSLASVEIVHWKGLRVNQTLVFTCGTEAKPGLWLVDVDFDLGSSPTLATDSRESECARFREMGHVLSLQITNCSVAVMCAVGDERVGHVLQLKADKRCPPGSVKGEFEVCRPCPEPRCQTKWNARKCTPCAAPKPTFSSPHARQRVGHLCRSESWLAGSLACMAEMRRPVRTELNGLLTNAFVALTLTLLPAVALTVMFRSVSRRLLSVWQFALYDTTARVQASAIAQLRTAVATTNFDKAKAIAEKKHQCRVQQRKESGNWQRRQQGHLLLWHRARLSAVDEDKDKDKDKDNDQDKDKD